MTEKAGPNWTKRSVIVAIGLAIPTMLCTILSNAPAWVSFLEQRRYGAAWLLPWVRLVQRWWRAVFAGAALLLVAVLLWWFRRHVIRLFKWLGGLPKRFYLWLLWQLVIRPARDHFPQQAVSPEHLERALASLRSEMLKRVEDAAATVEREPRGSEETVRISACKAKIQDLSGHGVSVLEYLLRLYRIRSGTVIREDVSDPEFPASPLKSLTGAHRQAALEELVEKGFLQEYSWKGDTLQAHVTECLSKRSVAGVLLEWLQELMVEG